jgi:FkbM family methyltransferase
MSEALENRDFLQDYGMVAYYSTCFYNMFVRSLRRKSKDIYTVFDVGFNTGQFTRLAIECFKHCKTENLIHKDAKLRIIAFEPNNFLADVAPPFEGLEIHRLALSDSKGTSTLSIPLFEGEPADLAKGSATHRNRYGGVYGTSTLSNERKEDLLQNIPSLGWQKLEVTTTTLDKFCQEHEIDEIDWLKIDVEVFEKNVLQGAIEMLKNGKIASGQFEGDTKFNATSNISTALGNNHQTQTFIDKCKLILFDANYTSVTLPTLNPLIENEFFFAAENK